MPYVDAALRRLFRADTLFDTLIAAITLLRHAAYAAFAMSHADMPRHVTLFAMPCRAAATLYAMLFDAASATLMLRCCRATLLFR